MDLLFCLRKIFAKNCQESRKSLMLYFLGFFFLFFFFFFLSSAIFDISWAISHDEVRYGMRFLFSMQLRLVRRIVVLRLVNT